MKANTIAVVEAFRALGVTGEAVITELVRFRVLDEMLQKSPVVRQWGVTADKLYELAQRSTTEICGPIPYDQAGMETVYSKSFTVNLMDVIEETGYVGGIAAGRRWEKPMDEVISELENTEGIILFANIEEYAAVAEDILQRLPADRLIFYTASETCYSLFKTLYPLAPITDEWPEDVIFDHIVSGAAGLFRAPVTIMEELANRVGNIEELGTAHYFIPLASIQDQTGMNRMAIQYMLLQPRLEKIREWAPLGAYEFVYNNYGVKKVALEIREVLPDKVRSTPFIALPHEVLASMDTFSMVQYALSLCGVKPALNAQDPTMSEDGYIDEDGRLPEYLQNVFRSYTSTRLEVTRKGTKVALRLVDHEGIPADTKLDTVEFDEAIASYEAKDDTHYWIFTNPVAAYIWYSYLRSTDGQVILQKLAQMVLSTEALLQLMGSLRRQVIKGDALTELAQRFEAARDARKKALAEADEAWQKELDGMAAQLLPEITEA